MACGIQTLYTVKTCLPEKFCLKLLNALVVSQIQHPPILVNGISQKVITSIAKQLSWAVKACFNRNKSDSSSDLKIKHSIFPIKLCLNIGLLHIFGNTETVCYQHSRRR